MSKTLVFPNSDKVQFVLLGWGHKLCEIADIIIDSGLKKPIILTHPKKYHKRDNQMYENTILSKDIFTYAKKNNLKIIETDNPNDSNTIKKILKLNCNVAFSLGCRSIIKKNFLDSFNQLVFNIHPSYLPEGKGAANFSWRILNQQKFVAGTIHQMDEGIDTGSIIIQEKSKNNIIKLDYPIDYDIHTMKLYNKIFKRFINKIILKEDIILIKQNLKNSSYFSRLYAKVNGAIDFNWTAEEIERFVRAFSYPYEGAFTYIKNQKVHIQECVIEKTNLDNHPFTCGKIYKIYSDKVIGIIVKNGRIKLKIDYDKIRITDRLHTPSHILDQSKIQNINVKNML